MTSFRASAEGSLPSLPASYAAINNELNGEDPSLQRVGEIISKEHKRKPLSDEKLRIMLEKKGYSIARRTVAKYREQLNIPVARLRKEL